MNKAIEINEVDLASLARPLIAAANEYFADSKHAAEFEKWKEMRNK